MSGSGGRLNILKNLSSKIDKLFLGDMIESNSSKSKSNYKSNSNSDYNSDYKSNPNLKSSYESEYYNYPEDNYSRSDYSEDKYSKYIYPEGYDNQFIRNDTFIKDSGYEDNYNNSNYNNSDYNMYNDYNGYNGYNDYDDYDRYNWYDEYNSNSSNSKDNKKISDFFNLKDLKNKLLNYKNPSKKNFGVIAFCLIFLILGGSLFYFGFYQPFQNELNTEKTAKLNELNTLYKGPLAISDHVFYFENIIEESHDVDEIKSLDILRTATEDWRKYHVIKINAFEDQYGRIMMSFDNESKKVIMPEKDAKLFVRENDAKILSNIAFEKVDTVIIPVSITRLQATGGLISVGSIVDIYTLNSAVGSSSNSDDSNGNESDKSMELNEEPDVSGATVLAILRSKDSGVVDSSINSATNLIKGNKTYPTENSKSFSTDVEELLKSSVFNAYDNNALDSYLNSYGVKLSDFERLSNIGELDTEYLVLLEVPRSDVSFVINNMENLILTIPTEYAPNWAIDELSETYYKELNYDKHYF